MGNLGSRLFFSVQFLAAVIGSQYAGVPVFAEDAQEVSPRDSTAAPKATGKKVKGNNKSVNGNKTTGSKDSAATSEESPPSGEVVKKAIKPNFKKVGLGLTGGFVYLGGGGGLEGWYSPSKKLDLSFRAVGASSKMSASGDAYYLETAQITMVQVAANARYFFGNSFYVLGGFGYNTFSGSYGVTVNSTKEEVLLPMQASAGSANLAVGNMWKWDSGFTLGFDWIGYSSFMGTSLKLDDPQTDREKEVFTDFKKIPGGGDPTEKAKALVTKNNIYFLLMSLGFAF